VHKNSINFAGLRPPALSRVCNAAPQEGNVRLSSIDAFLHDEKALFRAFAEHSSSAFWLIDLDGVFRYISPSWRLMFPGGRLEDYIGANFRTLLHPDDRARCESIMENVVAGREKVMGVEYRVVLPDGAYHWHSSNVAPLTDETGRVIAVIGVGYDIHEQKLLRETLKASEARHQLLADHAVDTVWSIAPDGRIVYVSPAVEKARGLTPAEAMAQPFEEIHTPLSLAKVLAYLQDMHAAIAAGRRPKNFRGELEYYRKDGSIFWSEVIACPVLDDDGSLREIVGVSRDLSERKEYEAELIAARRAAEEANAKLRIANQRLSQLSIRDPLTGAWNRRHFEELLTTELHRFQRHGRRFALIMFDIDHFKAVNDRHGHPVGDQVLISLTRIAQASLRRGANLARLGGEEFVILEPDCTLEEAKQIAERLRRAVENHDFPHVGRITASFGVIEARSGESEDEMIDRVDAAMYASKKGGRNTVTIF
jgi:diguanylate cyclase (GGDEF)-like protein/PAS domain S-box-containing protein